MFYKGSGQFVISIPKHVGSCQKEDGSIITRNPVTTTAAEVDMVQQISENEESCLTWCENEKRDHYWDTKENNVVGCQFNGLLTGTIDGCLAVKATTIVHGNGDKDAACWTFPV